MPFKKFLRPDRSWNPRGRGEVRCSRGAIPRRSSPGSPPCITTRENAGRVKARPPSEYRADDAGGRTSAQEASVLRGRVLYLNRADVQAGRVVFYSGSDRPAGAGRGQRRSGVLRTSARPARTTCISARRRGNASIPPPSVVIDTDVADGVMKIRPIKGMFDDEI